MAVDKGIVQAILVGDADMINADATEGINPSMFTIVDNKDELQSIAQAVDMINAGEADILMKGLCSTDKYMRAILNKERGLLLPRQF